MASKQSTSLDRELQYRKSSSPDGGWGWIVVLSSFCANMIIDGLSHSFGLFIPVLQDTYKCSQAMAALVGGVFYALQFLAGPFSSAFINKFGCRVSMFTGSILCGIVFFICVWTQTIVGLLITYGIVGGIGCSLIYLPAIVHVTCYFDGKRALATGITTAGSGFGLFTLAPIIAYLIDEYTWKGTMWFVSGIFLNCLVCASLLRPVPIENHKEELVADQFNESTNRPPVTERPPNSSNLHRLGDFLKNTVDLKLLRRPIMVAICLVNFFGMSGFFVPLVYMNNHAQSHGFSSQEASFLLSIEGCANTAGRIVFGLVADRKWLSALAIQSICMLICGCVTLAFPSMVTYESMIIYAVVFGFFIGSFNSLPSVIVVDAVGLENLTHGFGLVTFCRGISVLAGPPVASKSCTLYRFQVRQALNFGFTI